MFTANNINILLYYLLPLKSYVNTKIERVLNMEKEYVLKTGNFYLSKYFLDPNKPETNFISGVIFVTNIDTALKLTIEKAKYLDKMFYIETGLNFEIKEVEK